MFCEFFEKCIIEVGSNETYVCLIPKKEGQQGEGLQSHKSDMSSHPSLSLSILLKTLFFLSSQIPQKMVKKKACYVTLHLS